MLRAYKISLGNSLSLESEESGSDFAGKKETLLDLTKKHFCSKASIHSAMKLAVLSLPKQVHRVTTLRTKEKNFDQVFQEGRL